MFSQETIDEIEAVAKAEGIEAAALLAVAEVESGGRAFAFIGGKKEPLIRFEGHYFDRLIKPAKRHDARKTGLAARKWGTVKNPRGQADRWKMLERAMAFDRSAALQSVSWGIGQVMGSHWKALGYASPDALAEEARSSVAGQVRLMVRFIRVNGLAGALAARDWAGFARRYNGPAYKKNHYDTRMAAAYIRHKNNRLKRSVVPKMRKADLANRFANDPAKVKQVQQLLTAAGFALKIDGSFGPKTRQALKAFQAMKGLTVDGIYGAITQKALIAAAPKLNLVKGWSAMLRAIWRPFKALNRFK